MNRHTWRTALMRRRFSTAVQHLPTPGCACDPPCRSASQRLSASTQLPQYRCVGDATCKTLCTQSCWSQPLAFCKGTWLAHLHTWHVELQGGFFTPSRNLVEISAATRLPSRRSSAGEHHVSGGSDGISAGRHGLSLHGVAAAAAAQGLRAEVDRAQVGRS